MPMVLKAWKFPLCFNMPKGYSRVINAIFTDWSLLNHGCELVCSVTSMICLHFVHICIPGTCLPVSGEHFLIPLRKVSATRFLEINVLGAAVSAYRFWAEALKSKRSYSPPDYTSAISNQKSRPHVGITSSLCLKMTDTQSKLELRLSMSS